MVSAAGILPETHRVKTGDGGATTIHVLRLAGADHAARVVVIDPVQPLVEWCAANKVANALIGGFYVRVDGTPLGEVRIDGRKHASRPFDDPWGDIRACVHSDAGRVSLRSRLELPPEPTGDLLQAGPMLVRDRVAVVRPGADDEGFSAGARQFDSDITVGRHPRAALGVNATELIAAVCDGRTDSEAGLDLAELAQAMIGLGADDAINLDGGGSASLVVAGDLVNVPHEEHGAPIAGGRSVPTALAFTPL
jgi:hypothetical protein